MKNVKLISISLIVAMAGLFATAFAERNITIAPGFAPDPITRDYLSGGSMDASDYESINLSNDTCGGYMNGEEPDHVLTLTADFDYLRVYVDSDEDTTMVILTPGGNVYCYDDQYGLDPMTESAWAAGTYYIYIGTYGEPNEYYAYTLYVTEFE